jgi:leucine-zipper-like transcriptional regulator 1
MVRYNKSFYIFGGKGEKKRILAELKKYELGKNKWTDLKGEGTAAYPRMGHVSVVFGHSMYIFGGWDGQACLDDLF